MRAEVSEYARLVLHSLMAWIYAVLSVSDPARVGRMLPANEPTQAEQVFPRYSFRTVNVLT